MLTLLTSRRALPLEQASPQLVTPATLQALQHFQVAVQYCVLTCTIDHRFAGVPAEHQLLTYCGRQLQTGLVASQIQSEGTISLIYRLHGGQQTSTVKVTLQPRIQKEKWSMYWKESMATKTDSFEAITVEADVNTTVAKLQQVWQVDGSSLACNTAMIMFDPYVM